MRRAVHPLVCSVLTLSLWLWPTGGLAQMTSAQTPSEPKIAPLEFGGRLAAASPIGMFGVEASVNATDWFTLRVGGGASPTGAQASLLLSARQLIGEHRALGFGSGISFGTYDLSSIATPDGSGSNYGAVSWWNSELFYESRGDSFVLRPFVGVSVPITGSATHCDGNGRGAEVCKQRQPPILPMLGLSLSWQLHQRRSPLTTVTP